MLHGLPVLKRMADRVLETAKKTVVGGVGWSCTILDMAEISSYDHTPQDLHRDAPPYTIPEGTLIVNCLIMLTHNHEEEDGSHFLFVPSSSSGFPDPWVERAVPFKRGTDFFFNALDVPRGSGSKLFPLRRLSGARPEGSGPAWGKGTEGRYPFCASWQYGGIGAGALPLGSMRCKHNSEDNEEEDTNLIKILVYEKM